MVTDGCPQADGEVKSNICYWQKFNYGWHKLNSDYDKYKSSHFVSHYCRSSQRWICGKYRKQESSEMECVQWLNMKALAPMGLLVSAYATESRVFVRRGRGCAKGRLLMIDC